jgi:hypothetical protein
MKYILFISLLFFSCTKNNENNGCKSAEVTKAIIKGCYADTVWGIKVENKTYPVDFTSDTIPAEFQQEGLKVCIQYDTAMYFFMCPCCYDGPYAKIISIQKAE